MMPNPNTIHETKSLYVVPFLLCVGESCEEKAIWGTNWAPIHCDAHKTSIEEAFVEKRCSSCGRIYVVDKDKTCKRCKLAENTFVPISRVDLPTHPKFSINIPSIRATKSSHDILSRTLRSTKSSPEILTRSPAHSSTINLKSKLSTLQTKSDLQIAVVDSKKRLATTRTALAQYSLIDNSASKIAARDAHAQAEKDVEEACRAWCYASRH